MGLDAMALMGLLTGGGNLLGQVGNLGTQGLGNLNTVMDMLRYAQRNRDPLLTELRQGEINQYNEAPYGPYGDVGGAFDALWGERSDGSPVQYGDMAARQYNYMLNNNPGEGALEILGQGPSTRPASADFASMFGGNPSGAAYTPATIGVPDGKGFTRGSTQVRGLDEATKPDPILSDARGGGIGAQTLNSLDEDTLSGLLSGAIQGLTGSGGGGGGGGGGRGSGWTMVGAQPVRYTGGLSEQSQDRLGLNKTASPSPSAPADTTGPVKKRMAEEALRRGFAVGTPYVPKTGKTTVHEGEAVVPAGANPNAIMGQVGPKPAPGVAPGAPMPITPGVRTLAPTGTQPGTAGTTPTALPTPSAGGMPVSGGPGDVRPPVAPGVPGNPTAMQTAGQAGQVGTKPDAVMPDINAGRNSVLAQLIANPESLGPEAQAMLLQGVKDERDKSFTDEQRMIRELFGGAGTGDSGIQDRMLFDSMMGRSGDLATAKRNIGIEAARTNLGDRQNTANLLLGQQLGMGGAALDYDRFQQELVDRDRNYAMNLADRYFTTGVNSQQQQGQNVDALGRLTGTGTAFQDSRLNRIWQQLMSRYANPDISTGQQFGYAPNPYMDTGGGGKPERDWLDYANTAAQFF